MARIVLHIGTHGTDATDLQTHLATHAQAFARRGVIYPHFDGTTGGHHGLMAQWNPDLAAHRLPQGTLPALTLLAKRHAGRDVTVVLSSEEFARARAPVRVDFRVLRQALSGFDRIEVLCVLREQWRFVQSVVLEVMKTRVPAKPAHLVEGVLRQDMVAGLWTDYGLLYDHLLTAFAPEEITFLDYETARTCAGGVTRAVLARLGVDAGGMDLAPGSDRPAAPLAAQAAQIIAAPHRAPPWLIDAAAGALGVQFGEEAATCIWSRHEMRTLRDYARTRNAVLARRRATVDPGFAISETDPTLRMICRDDLGSEFWLRVNRWAFAITP